MKKNLDQGSEIEFTIINHNSTEPLYVWYQDEMFEILQQNPIRTRIFFFRGTGIDDIIQIQPNENWSVVLHQNHEIREDNVLYLDEFHFTLPYNETNEMDYCNLPENSTVYVSSRITILKDVNEEDTKYTLLFRMGAVLVILIILIILVGKGKGTYNMQPRNGI